MSLRSYDRNLEGGDGFSKLRNNLGKNYLWTCRQKVIKPSFSPFKIILVNKYETEKHIACKLNKTNLFRKKWKLYEKFFSSG